MADIRPQHQLGGRPIMPNMIQVGEENDRPIELHYKDWGEGRPVVFSHGWPLNADVWDTQLQHLAEREFRVVAHDRRGHGRSSQTWTGNDMDTYAEDLAQLLEQLQLYEVTLVGHSTGGGEVVRYLARHGSARVRSVVLVGAVTPLMLQTEQNPRGVPMADFDKIREGVAKDRSQFYRELSPKFYGSNRWGSRVSQGFHDAFWLYGMQTGLKPAYDCIKAFSETDFTEDLKKIDRRTLIIHGDDDQIVPIDVTARRSVDLIPEATLKVYPGAPHGLTQTNQEEFSDDLLRFVQELPDPLI